MSDLDRLFYWHGIAPNFVNYKGEHVEVPLDNRKTLLSTMGVEVNDEGSIKEEAFQLDVAPWYSLTPPIIVIEDGGFQFELNVSPEQLEKIVSWTMIEKGSGVEVLSGIDKPANYDEVGNYQYDETRFSRRAVPFSPIGIGYYTLTIEMDGQVHDSEIAVVPNKAYELPSQKANKKSWGVIIQLYTLLSERNWGIGDFSDLQTLIRHLSRCGADIIGLNPLHALSVNINEKCSPYSPSDRRFINPLYIDPEIEPEFSWLKNNENGILTTDFYCQIEHLRKANQVAYGEVKNHKYRVFEEMFLIFCHGEFSTEHQWEIDNFQEFIVRQGESLIDFARYCVEKNEWDFSENFGVDLNVAPILTNDCLTSVDVSRRVFVTFHLYLQWKAFEQLMTCQALTQELGMAVGLIRDLAVGADPLGAEVVSNGDLFCQKASIGAPPDPLAGQGQNWGLPPMDPAELRQTGFKHYIDLLRSNMSACGALRIDHAMSLQRLWWCPPNKTADHGAYVYYPFKELLGLLKLESVLNKCAIVGEDLGVVPWDFREAMAAAKIYANKVFYFEKENFRYFKSPNDYLSEALAMVNNHDVPTLTSWWNGSDLALRNQLNIFEEGVSYEEMTAGRAQDKYEVLNLLDNKGLLPSDWLDKNIDRQADTSLIYAILLVVGHANSNFYVVQLEDLIGMDEPVNVPGTFNEYPNWKRKLNKTVDSIFSDEAVNQLLHQLQATRSLGSR